MNVVFIHRFWRMDTLKFALRGVEKFVEYDKITVVGDVPEWWRYDAIETERKKDKYEDAVNNVRSYTATGDTLVMQDDFFLLKPYVPKVYYNTDFRLHCPMPVDKDLYNRLPKVDSYMNYFGRNTKFPKEKRKDCKIIDNKKFTYENLKDRDMFSTYNEREWMIPIFRKLGLY